MIKFIGFAERNFDRDIGTLFIRCDGCKPSVDTFAIVAIVNEVVYKIILVGAGDDDWYIVERKSRDSVLDTMDNIRGALYYYGTSIIADSFCPDAGIRRDVGCVLNELVQ